MVKRYLFTCPAMDNEPVPLEANTCGDWVKFTDHEAALSELQAKVNEVKHWNNNADDIIIALRLKAEDSRRREIALEERVKELVEAIEILIDSDPREAPGSFYDNFKALIAKAKEAEAKP